MFITQLGMVSLQEALYHGVPVLGVPLTVEQNLNTDIVTSNHLGSVLHLEDVTEELLMVTIKDLLNNKTYRENSQQFSNLVKNFHSKSLEVGHISEGDYKFSINQFEDAIWWSEYVMTNRGCDHLKSPHRSEQR